MRQSIQKTLDEFVEWGAALYAPRTVDTYQSLLRRFIKHIGDMEVSKVSIVHVSQYIATLKTRNHSEASIAYMATSLRVFFRYIYERRLNDWDYRLIRIPRFVTNHFPTVRTEEVMSMMQTIRVTDFQGLRDSVIFKFLEATGVRNSELCELSIDNIDTDAMSAQIKTKKSKKWRVVPWDYATNEVIKEYLLEREKYAHDDMFIISTAWNPIYCGRGVTPRTIQRIVSKYRVGGRRVVPHSFRSRHITLILENSKNIELARRGAGHESLSSLKPYIRLSQSYVVDEIRKARGWLTGSEKEDNMFVYDKKKSRKTKQRIKKKVDRTRD